MGTQQVRSYRTIQNNESKLIASSLLEEPTRFEKHFERYAASVVSIIAYGRRVPSYLDPIITEVIAIMQFAAELNVPGKTFPMLMETFPILAKFPNWMAPWKMGLGRRRSGKDFFFALAEEANEESPNDNFARQIFDLKEKYDLDDREISAISGNLFGAGSDTSSSTLVTMVLAAVMFPDAAAKAQKEIDEVVGSDRSPDFDDLLNMPYVEAFVKEVFRWRSVAIIGGQPHAPIQDDYYNGWFIPKNTWVQGNLWYPYPLSMVTSGPYIVTLEIFPTQIDSTLIDISKRIGCHIRTRKDITRLVGDDEVCLLWIMLRLVCSGQALAEQGTHITVARLLWGFNFLKKKDAQGKEIGIDIFDYTNGLNWRPRPFECIIEPRSEKIAATIRREGEKALEELLPYNGTTKYFLSIQD